MLLFMATFLCTPIMNSGWCAVKYLYGGRYPDIVIQFSRLTQIWEKWNLVSRMKDCVIYWGQKDTIVGWQTLIWISIKNYCDDLQKRTMDNEQSGEGGGGGAAGDGEIPEIELIIRASTIDGRRKGACLFCQVVNKIYCITIQYQQLKFCRVKLKRKMIF